ncbi:MAG: GTP-binding protein [Micropruina sp.]|uniref:CobW family GTP-binding protein n=1 Tax=Micropruina sp. TaxID=2737536 RepID=UPI0039E3B13C
MSGIGRVPVILVGGVADGAMSAVTVGLQWDLPSAVVVRHEIDPAREVLIRTVSDADGLIERVELDVEHACVSCAIREDVVPTLERLAACGSWGAVIAQLPVTAEATQVCRVIGYQPDAAPHLRIAATVAALDSDTARDDLFGADLLVERELPVREDDLRGVAETASAMVEYADLIVAHGLGADTRELIAAIARPDAAIVGSTAEVDGAELLAGIHQHDHSEDWVQIVRREPLPDQGGESWWRLDLRSDRPFHPDRLQEHIERLGRGRHRSRGCFWLPSRPTQICQWDGAGGMVSIGPADHWDHAGPLTRIVVVGIDGNRDALVEAFRCCLLTDAELAERGPYWEVGHDGLEPWLGPVRGLPARWSA